MCFFPKKLNITDSFGNEKLIECGCGICPECLKRKSRQWALRCYYESLESPAMMITLTYDEFVRTKGGRIIGERLHANGTKCEKKHIQDFVKRLRKYITTKVDKNIRIKYLATAEYGKTTHRAHYHMIIFGYTFQDLVFHKYSKRGHKIHRSQKLYDLWTHGICTVDCINITPAVAQYCTKYCSKDNGKQDDDTFMLYSRGIGLNGLLKNFNGFRYIIEGMDYPIPRLIWQKVIISKYQYQDDFAMNYVTGELLPFSFKYRGKEYGEIDDPVRIFYRKGNRLARKLRDDDPLYRDYVTFWESKTNALLVQKPSIRERIKALDDQKYHFYKFECLDYLDRRDKGEFVPFLPREKHTKEKLIKRFIEFSNFKPKEFKTHSSRYTRIPFDCIDDVYMIDGFAPFGLKQTKYQNPKYLRFAPVITYDEYCLYARRFEKYAKLRFSHLPLDTCCIRANDTESEFKWFTKRFDIEKTMQLSLKTSKNIVKRFTLCSRYDKIQNEDNFAVQITMLSE